MKEKKIIGLILDSGLNMIAEVGIKEDEYVMPLIANIHTIPSNPVPQTVVQFSPITQFSESNIFSIKCSKIFTTFEPTFDICKLYENAVEEIRAKKSNIRICKTMPSTLHH